MGLDTNRTRIAVPLEGTEDLQGGRSACVALQQLQGLQMTDWGSADQEIKSPT